MADSAATNLSIKSRVLNRKNIGTSLAILVLFTIAVFSLGAATRVNAGVNSKDGNKNHTAVKPAAGAAMNASENISNDAITGESISDSTSSPVSHSSTTVTVDGQTETTNGNIDKTYTSEDGNSNVHVSVNNSSTGERE